MYATIPAAAPQRPCCSSLPEVVLLLVLAAVDTPTGVGHAGRREAPFRSTLLASCAL